MPLPPSRASGPYRPTRLGQWEVIAKIAGGGMSAVYLGRHVDSPPDAPNVVALKIARHDTSMDDRLVKMFLEEGRLIQKLIHPNIVRTLEVGAEAEQDFIAMELMLGKTFAQVHDTLAARNIRMSPEIAVWTAARVAEALEFAHQLPDEKGGILNLVHRDVNPANIFATFRGEVKLFDFGLAKVTTGDTSSSQQMLAGKLSYLSPEQVMQIPVDRRSDIFSLGTSLWEFLTAKRLFRRDSDIDTVRAVQLGPIPDVRTVAPELPEDLARIVKAALERNRDHRYPTAGYLARDLDAWLYQRTSPQDVTARLAQLVDTLFPGEQKRQSGWLKPAISSAMKPPPSGLAATMQSPSTPMKPEKPTGLEVRRDSRETTAVMMAAPIHTPAEGVPAVPGPPGPLTPRDGIPAIPPSSQIPSLPQSAAVSLAPSVQPHTPRFGSGSVPPPSAKPRFMGTQRMPAVTPPPISRTDIGLPLSPTEPPPKSDPPTDVTKAPAIVPEAIVPEAIEAEAFMPELAGLDIESTISASPSFVPPSPASVPPFPVAPKMPSLAAPAPRASVPPPSTRGSLPPPSMKPVASPSIAPKPNPSIAPKPTPAQPFQPAGALGAQRPARAPIPLPSRKGAIPLPSQQRASIAPKPNPSIAPPPAAPTPTPKTDTKPPDSSKTQIDMPAPKR